MLSTLTRKLIKAESKLKLAEDSENNRNFQESKLKFIRICQKIFIFKLLNGLLTDFCPIQGELK